MSDNEIKRGTLWRQSDKLFARYGRGVGETPRVSFYGLVVLEKNPTKFCFIKAKLSEGQGLYVIFEEEKNAF